TDETGRCTTDRSPCRPATWCWQCAPRTTREIQKRSKGWICACVEVRIRPSSRVHQQVVAEAVPNALLEQPLRSNGTLHASHPYPSTSVFAAREAGSSFQPIRSLLGRGG